MSTKTSIAKFAHAGIAGLAAVTGGSKCKGKSKSSKSSKSCKSKSSKSHKSKSHKSHSRSRGHGCGCYSK